jgi:hypothetical protein
MSSTLDMLHADLREIEAHLAVWPNDQYAISKYGAIMEEIEAATPPATSNQRPSTLRDRQFQNARTFDDALESLHSKARAAANSPRGASVSPCAVCDTKGPCTGCIHAKTNGVERNAMLMAQLYGKSATMVVFDDVTDKFEFSTPVIWNDMPSDGATRFTFGADYEMDQRWLAEEREKAAHPKMVTVRGRVYDVVSISTPAEPDLYAFPMMAYNLTSLHNLNYGTSRY